MKKVLSSVRSFFKANRAALPDDEHARAINQSEAPEDAPETLDLRIAKGAIDNSNEMYKAIFLAMIGGGMGIGEILKWSSMGVRSIKKGLINVQGQELLKIEFRSRKMNNRPYFTLIGGDALKALKVWMSVRDGKKIKYENKRKAQYPPDIFVTKTHNAVKEDQTLRLYWLRVLHRTGCIERKKGAPPSTRYGLNLHQMRDLFKGQWTIANRGREDKLSEFLMGHRIDSYNYNRFYEAQAGQQLIYDAYLKTLPFLNILSSTLPFGLVDSSTLAATNVEVDELKRQVQQLSQERMSLQKNMDEYKHDFEQRFQRRIDELREEEHVISLMNRLAAAQIQLERGGIMVLGSDDIWDDNYPRARLVTEHDIKELENELRIARKKLSREQLARVRSSFQYSLAL